MIILTIPKRPGHEQIIANKASKEEDMKAYFESLKIEDIEFELVQNRLLEKHENHSLLRNIRISQTKNNLTYE